MLSSLTIKNILFIDWIELDFKQGLNTMTGETGVGKSVLLGCLGFVLGWKNNSHMVRAGSNVGEVTAEFLIPQNKYLSNILEDCGIESGETILIRRSINRVDGRKRNFINDKSVSLDLIKRVATVLVELQDQTGNQILLNEESHVTFLDKFASLGSQLIVLQKLWKEKQLLTRKLELKIEKFESAKLQREYLEFGIEELQNFSLISGEEEELDSQRKKIRDIQRNKEKFDRINTLVTENNFENDISEIIKLLEIARKSVGDAVESSISALDRTLQELNFARIEIEKILELQNLDICDLENVEERLFKLRALARKYNVNTEELPKVLEQMSNQLSLLDSSQNDIADLQKEQARATKCYNEAASEISSKRLQFAEELDRNVINELKHLKMDGCQFKTLITPMKAGPRGVDRVVFSVMTNRGGNFGKLQTIASGGEVSRFLLALKVCLTVQDHGTTMIFDEIDRGIGGATADAVGRRLAMLAKHGQIIVVTHSPQVAAHGDYQWKVEKLNSESKSPVTQIRQLSPEDRLAEIARMLSGRKISREALAAAKKLLG